MAKKSEFHIMVELATALLVHLQKYPTEGLSVPFIQINMMAGTPERITEYLNTFEERKVGEK
jgi:hypothetical protein